MFHKCFHVEKNKVLTDISRLGHNEPTLATLPSPQMKRPTLDERTTTRIPPKLKNAIRKIATERICTEGQVLRDALVEYVERNQAAKDKQEVV